MLEQGLKIDLLNDVPVCVKQIRTQPQFLSAKQYSALCRMLGNNESVIALHGGDQPSKNKTHLLARTMSGRFSSIEEVEGKTLHSFVKKLAATNSAQASFLIVLDFSKKCFTGVFDVLTAGTKRGEVTKQSKGTKHPLVLHAANAYLMEPTSSCLRSFLLTLKSTSGVSAYRRDLLYRLLNVLKMHILSEGKSLTDSANLYQRDMRHTGRPLNHRKLIGTTLLVKGLEYDHAVILDADALDAKDLYVAMTRGTNSLTIIGSGASLPRR